MRLSLAKPRVWIALGIVAALWTVTTIRHVGGPLSWGLLGLLLFVTLAGLPDEREMRAWRLRDWVFWALIVGGLLWVFFAPSGSQNLGERPY